MSRLWIGIGVAFLLGIGADLLVGASPPGYIAAFSFIGCIVIIVASKWLGKALLQRREQYYGEAADA